MKYKVINTATQEKHLCDKVALDGYDYYVSEECDDLGGWHIDIEFDLLINLSRHNVVDTMRKVIATTNPNVDVPKVVDEVDIRQLAIDGFTEEYSIEKPDGVIGKTFRFGFVKGYNKSQETHPFSEEDVIEFAKWCSLEDWRCIDYADYLWDQAHKANWKSTKELLEMWKAQRPKTVYCE